MLYSVAYCTQAKYGCDNTEKSETFQLFGDNETYGHDVI